jgi:hypothetical protein
MFIVPIVELMFNALPRLKVQGQTLKMFTALPLVGFLVEMQIFRFEAYAKRRRKPLNNLNDPPSSEKTLGVSSQSLRKNFEVHEKIL